MTEQEWLSCNNPQIMLVFLRGKVTERKLRLFGVACCRSVWLHVDGASKTAVRAAEDFIEGKIKAVTLRNASRNARSETMGATFLGGPTSFDPIDRVMAGAVSCLDRIRHLGDGLRYGGDERIQQSVYLRDIVGDPFRPQTIDPAWRTTNVRQLAQTIYQKRTFDRLPIVGDALEDAGCTSQDVLDHCRQPGEHVRGCWTLDLILGRE